MILSRTSSSGRRVGAATSSPRDDRTDSPTGSGAVVPPRRPSEDTATRYSTAIAQNLRLSVDRPATGVVVVRMTGEVDLATVPRLTELIRQRMTAAALHAIVLDLSEVSFISSSGMEWLLYTQRRAEHRGIRMFVVPGSPTVCRLLRLTGLTHRFVCRDSVPEAAAEAGH